ncbi:DUF418 domain-containing protein [Metabacillus schmidteae]|uniref:DUF418 domain-containing protein n=1 Tax=Metabacillus schmidteae TaxID=2730405 RepID=UPI00158E8821|nr:DUF418 domain-containing protein [Metabacillus schmidteae]
MKEQKRILIVDIIRGLALFGILLMNMRSFNSPEFIESMYGITPNFKELDKIIHNFYGIFVHMKFYPIFSFLFGLSFYLFLRKGFDVILFTRRMLILFIIGVIHLIFIWYGDILHVYALISIFLLLFYKVNSKGILYWAAALLTIYHLLLSWSTFFSTHSPLEQGEFYEMLSNYNAIYQEAPYIDWVLYRFDIEVIRVLFQFPFTFVPVLAWFLLGLYVGKEGLFERTSSNIVRVKRWWRISLFVSFGFLILRLFAHIYLPSSIYLLTSVSGIGMAILYITSIYVFFDHSFVKTVFYPLRYVGRMSLSNYLFQSIFLISFVRVFNLYNNISLSEGLIISIFVFLFQLIISKYWLSYFYQGPIEWIWRSISLKKISPFIKK